MLLRVMMKLLSLDDRSVSWVSKGVTVRCVKGVEPLRVLACTFDWSGKYEHAILESE